MTEVNSNPESVLGDLAALPIWAARGAPAGVVASKRAPINPRTGRLAKNDTPTTWASRAKAVKRAAHYPAEREPGVGLMLGEAHAPEGWVRAGLDLDGCRVPRTGDLEPWAREIAHRFDTLTESSPSGTGLHLLFYARAADVATLRAEGLIEKVGRSFSRGGHVEIAAFFGGKFMAVTDDFLPLGDDPLLGDLDTIRAVSLANLRWLLAEYGPEWAGAGDGPGVAGLGDESGSGHAFRLALDLAREGLAPEEIAERIAADEGDAGEWWARTTDRERDRTVTRATEKAAADTTALVALLDDLPEVEGAGARVMTRKNGEPEATAHNAIIFLGRACKKAGLGIRHNSLTGEDEWKAGEIRDSDLTLIRVEIERAGMRNVGDTLTARAVRAVAERNAYHPVREWLNGLTHDGRPTPASPSPCRANAPS